jgi:pimeloyl-ACP methyl ester carboxylesterase
MTASASWPLATERVARLERLIDRHDVSVQGRSVVWRRLGQGSPLVLLHGGHGSWLHWVRNLVVLAQQHAVWVPDLPGYGDSDAPEGADLDGLVDALHHSLDALLGVGTPIRLLGFSFGGLVAATLAVRRPAVTRLALLGPAGHGGIRRPRGELQAWQHLPVGSAPWQDAMRHNLLMHMLHAPSGIDDLALQVHGQSCLATRFHSKKISRDSGLPPALDAYTGPVLLVWGEHDVTAAPRTVGPQLIRARPQRELEVIEDAGHWVQFEKADRVNALIRAWME